MDDQPLASIKACFGDIDDPRVTGRCSYPLTEIIIIAICGMLSGADTWVGVETFGKTKEEWLKQFLELKNGIPAHDTFGDVFRMLDADEFQRCFMEWVRAVFTITQGQVIALDGKTLRGSRDQTAGQKAVHLVNAWASANGIVLGQRQVDGKTNEITALPEMLDLLNVAGCIVTIDAMGCQKKIAQKIRDEEADYVLRVKDNQANLHQDLADWFAYADQVDFQEMQAAYHKTVNKGHGRLEIRECWTVTDARALAHIRHAANWADLQTIVRLRRVRHLPEKIEEEIAYFITSLTGDAALILDCVRAHWSIENSFHWVMDVTFREDEARSRKENAAQNGAVIRSLVLNMLKQDPSPGSLRQKRYKASLDDVFRLKLLSQF